MSAGSLNAADAAVMAAELEEAELAFAEVAPVLEEAAAFDEPAFWASSCFESWSSLSMISVSRTVVVVLVPPSVVPESAVSSDRSSELVLEPRSDVRRDESLSLPKSDDSVLNPVVEDRPRSDDAVSPVPSVLELEELELLELDELEAEELSDADRLPTERVGIEGMDGPEISGILMLDMLWAASCGMRRPDSAGPAGSSMTASTTGSVFRMWCSCAVESLTLQHRKLFFDHFEA